MFIDINRKQKTLFSIFIHQLVLNFSSVIYFSDFLFYLNSDLVRSIEDHSYTIKTNRSEIFAFMTNYMITFDKSLE